MRALAVSLALACAPAMAQGLAHPEDSQFFNGARWQHAGAGPAAPSLPASTKALWGMNGTAGESDATGNYPLTTTDRGFGTNTPGSAAGHIGNCRTWTVTGQYLEATPDAALNAIFTGGSFTWEQWVNIPSASGTQIIIDFSNASFQGYFRLWITTARQVAWQWYNSAGTQNAGSVPTVTLSTWTHLALKYDSVAQTTQIYVGGTLQATQTSVLPPEAHAGTFHFVVGARSDYGAAYFVGSMDSIHLSNTALSDAQIAADAAG